MTSKRRATSRATTVYRLPITQARINLGALVKRARLNKEYFILEKDGIPVAGLMDIDAFEDYLELHDPVVARQVQESAAEYRAGKSRAARSFLEELSTRAMKKPRRPRMP